MHITKVPPGTLFQKVFKSYCLLTQNKVGGGELQTRISDSHLDHRKELLQEPGHGWSIPSLPRAVQGSTCSPQPQCWHSPGARPQAPASPQLSGDGNHPRRGQGAKLHRGQSAPAREGQQSLHILWGTAPPNCTAAFQMCCQTQSLLLPPFADVSAQLREEGQWLSSPAQEHRAGLSSHLPPQPGKQPGQKSTNLLL